MTTIRVWVVRDRELAVGQTLKRTAENRYSWKFIYSKTSLYQTLIYQILGYAEVDLWSWPCRINCMQCTLYIYQTSDISNFCASSWEFDITKFYHNSSSSIRGHMMMTMMISEQTLNNRTLKSFTHFFIEQLKLITNLSSLQMSLKPSINKTIYKSHLTKCYFLNKCHQFSSGWRKLNES